DAAKQGTRTLFGVRGKLGATEVAYHERVAGQHEPRFIGTSAVGYEEGDMFRCVARCVQHFDRDIPEVEDVAVAHTSEQESRFSFREQDVIGASSIGEGSA